MAGKAKTTKAQETAANALKGAMSKAAEAAVSTRSIHTVGVENATTSNILRIVRVSVAKSKNTDGLNVLFHNGLRNSNSSRGKSPEHANVFLTWAELRSTYCTTQYSVVKDSQGVAVRANLLGLDESKEVNLHKLLKDNPAWVTEADVINLLDEDIFVYCKNIFTSYKETPSHEDHSPYKLMDGEAVVEKCVYLRNEVTGFAEAEVSTEVDAEYTEEVYSAGV